MLRYSLDLDTEADAVEAAVAGFLAEGNRTVDIAVEGEEWLGTSAAGDVIASMVAGA